MAELTLESIKKACADLSSSGDKCDNCGQKLDKLNVYGVSIHCSECAAIVASLLSVRPNADGSRPSGVGTRAAEEQGGEDVSPAPGQNLRADPSATSTATEVLQDE